MNKKWILILMSVGLIGTTTAQTGTSGAETTWSLTRCIEYAVQNNISVKQATLTQKSSEITYQQSKLERLPSLSIGASQSMSAGKSIDPITSDYVSRVVHSTNLSINPQVTLFNGGQITSQIQQNQLLVQQNELYVEEAQNNITLSLIEAYLQALSYKEGIRIAENNVAASQKELDRSNIKYSAGAIAAKELADVQSQHASNQYSVVTAQNAYNQQVLTIKQLLELEPQQPFDIEAPELEGTTARLVPDKMEVYSKALSILPEVKADRLQMDITGKNLDMAKAGYLPTVSLSAGLSSGYTNSQRSSFFDQLNGGFNQRMGLNVNVPIFDKNQTKARVQKARIDIEKAQLSTISTNKDLYRKIETAWQNAVAAQNELISAQVARDASKTSYELSQQQFAVGSLSTTDYLVAQNTYVNAEQKCIQSKYTCILYSLLLQFYQGNPIKL